MWRLHRELGYTDTSIHRLEVGPRVTLRPLLPTMTFNVLLVGAGEINFGSVEGPWNHSRRLESKLGTSLRVVGLVDPDQSRAAAALAGKQASDAAPAYASCKTFSTVAEAAESLSNGLPPQCVFPILWYCISPRVRDT